MAGDCRHRISSTNLCLATNSKIIFKYRGLVLSISLIILIFVVRIPLEITALTLPFYLMMLFGLFLFWKDRKL